MRRALFLLALAGCFLEPRANPLDPKGPCAGRFGTDGCECPIGFTGSEDGSGCVDLDECVTDNGGCDSNAICTNTIGDRACECKQGFTGDGLSCADTDECATNNGGCDANATCANTTGSRMCSCNEGYAGNGTTCADVNECLTNDGGCDANATCANTAGSRTCTCKTGYSGSGTSCADIDECATNNGGCDVNATCANTTGSRMCSCNEGYAGNGTTCADVNECLTNNGGCDANATCANTAGSRTCTCKTGYSGSGTSCADIDECATNNGGCVVNATCANTTGSRTCTCKAGYSGSGTSCADIDECATNNGGCAATETCRNHPGSFTCELPAGTLVTKTLAGVTFVFSFIPAGSFLMGSPDTDTEAYSDEKPQHQVTLTKPFLMLRNEVTQAQYEAVMGTNPSYFTGDTARPVEPVSWYDAVSFCARLSQLESGATYRLPTEAEWEYAARAGTTTRRYGAIDDIAWYSGNSSSTTHPVKQKLPNAWGLYDMLGNVWEWTGDWYGTYAHAALTDPTGPSTGSLRVLRGGSWGSVALDARAACRGNYGPGNTRDRLGFRPLRSLP